ISYGQVHSRANSGTRLTEQLLRYVSPNYAVSYPNAAVPINSFIFADTSEDLEGCGNCVYNDSMPNLFAGYHSIILNTISRNSARYFAYLFKSDTWRKQIRTAVSGVKVFSISRRILKACSLLVPPLPEQAAIVAYLDKKCAAIDELMSRHGQIVEKLKELKASAIAHVVTGKIDIREGA
ncbi:MAG: restriction endonuclease subunit S, partial [Akkermansia sp.]